MNNIGLVFFILFWFSFVHGNQKYDQLCDQMIQHAADASTFHNAGNVAAAHASVDKVRDVFGKATEMMPNEPQAFLNLAVFLTNIHEYDESIERFEHARTLLGSDIPRQVESQIYMGVRRAKNGKYSMKRDQAYANGHGNISEAHYWGLQQLTVSNELFRINHEVATLEVMLCEYDADMCLKSQRHFAAAASISQGLYVQTRQPDAKKEAKLGCLHSKMVLGDFRDAAAFPPNLLVTVEEVEEGLFINKINEELSVFGKDGVMTFADEKHCHLASSSSDAYTDFGRSVLVPPRPAQLVLQGSVLSLLQFSGAAFYHWMCEIIPRLATASSHIGHDIANYKILVPSIDGKVPSFIRSTFDSFFPEIPPSNIIAHDRNTVLKDGSLVVSWARQTCPEFVANAKTTFHCASLAHPSALQAARNAVSVDEVTKGYNDGRRPYVLVAGRGSDTVMRHFEEEKLIAAVKKGLSDANLDVRVFDALHNTLSENLRLFYHAEAVVGVHGGALSNIIACRVDTPIIEIGMATVGAQQYAHVANALGLRHLFVSVKPDILKRSISAPTVAFDEVEVERAVRLAFPQDGSAEDL